MVRALGVRSVVSVPMIARGRTVGVITCCQSDSARRYGPGDVTVAKEIGQRAALAIDNARLFEKAQEAARAREEFLSVAAHELHTPVTSLHLMMQALERGGAGDPGDCAADLRDGRSSGAAPHQAHRRAAGRVAHPGAPFSIERETVDLAGLVRDVVDRFGDDAARAGSCFSVETAGPAVGQWDPLRLEQVVSNLLSNAIKFGAGRPIEIAVGARTERLGWPSAITASGCRPTASRTSSGGSSAGCRRASTEASGLGLYIVRSIVESMGGDVRCEETPGGGSTFRVSLAVAHPGGPEGARESRHEEGAEVAAARILVVDDDVDIRDATRLVLEHNGYRVVAASNGEEALRLLQDGPVDLILLDMMMPVMDGWGFRRSQPDGPAFVRIPVIVLTGDGRASSKAAAIGAAGYLRKPLDLDDLLAMIARHCALA